MKLTKYLVIFILMFTFFSKSSANYEKLAYDFSFKDINNKDYDLSQHKGKTLLIVNVASQCGFTKQYEDLQSLYTGYKDKGLIIVGLPSNDFGGQEPGTNQEIKNFCESKFGITFPLMNKVKVLGEQQHPFYKWVENNYGKSGIPKWNFYKVLINKDGKIEDVYSSITNPQSSKIVKKLKEIL